MTRGGREIHKVKTVPPFTDKKTRLFATPGQCERSGSSGICHMFKWDFRNSAVHYTSSGIPHNLPVSCLGSDQKFDVMILWILAVIGPQWIWFSYCIGRYLRRLVEKSVRAKRQCCQPPPDMPRKDPLLGLDITLDSYSNIKNHTYLQRCQERFLQHGTTFKSNSLGANAIYTIDPDNVKTVLAGKFEDYRLGQRREDAFVPLIGHGIFTADGEGWKHSRRLLHPSFTRRQVGDLDVYERHLMNLIRLIPQDGSSTVDLQRLFFDFTMDTGTEIFCGQSSFCLAPEKQGPMSTNFAHAFNQSQRTIADGVALGPLAFATHTPSFNKDRDTVHEFIDHFVRGALDMQSHIESSTSQGSEDESKKQESFLARLAQQVKDPICLRGELLNVMIAGRDTTASLVTAPIRCATSKGHHNRHTRS